LRINIVTGNIWFLAASAPDSHMKKNAHPQTWTSNI